MTVLPLHRAASERLAGAGRRASSSTRRRLLCGVLAALVASAASSDETGTVEHGQAVFERHCAACHGNGRGDESEGAAALPGTLALRLKYQGTLPALLEQRTDLSVESITTFVRNGVASMPPFRPTEVTDADIAAIAAFLARHHD